MTESIVVRSPMRVSFGGGGTDLEAYYARFGGFVVSAAIARYAYVSVREPHDGSVRLGSADYRIWESYDRGVIPPAHEPLALAKAALAAGADRRLRERGVDLFMASEVPPGTGLGSSSAMAGALTQALAAYLDRLLTKPDLAEEACTLEIERLDMPIGKQDQYASVFGGINAMTFEAAGVKVVPLRLSPDAVSALGSRLLLFSTGTSRHSANILREQRHDTGRKPLVTESLHRIRDLAQEMRGALESEDLDRFGQLLHHAWMQKKRLSDRVSSTAIDGWYQTALGAGAVGGKITGAGGGGFLMLYCPVERQPGLREAMITEGLHELPFDFDFQGTHVYEGGGTIGERVRGIPNAFPYPRSPNTLSPR